MQGIDIIYFTLFPWDLNFSSVSLSFTREFAKQHRVFYINPPFTLKDVWTLRSEERVRRRLPDLLRHRMRYEQIPELPDNVIAVQPPAILPINWLPPGELYNRLQDWNEGVVLRCIQKVINDYQLTNFIYLNCFNPFVAGTLPPHFGAKLNIYQCIDDMSQEVYTAKHAVQREEQRVIPKTDLTFVTSTMLKKLKQPHNPDTYILHNAVDDSIFRRTLEETFERPRELQGVEGKIVGFTGNLDASRIDYPLLKTIAERHPEKTFVYVGPLNNTHYLEHQLDRMPNIIFTGAKNIHDLPRYLQYFDCVLIPFLCNRLTASIYPLKINEYLAAGKAVVSTNFSEDIRSFKDVIYLAKDSEHFVQLIDTAMAENSDEKIKARVARANSNTWTARVEQFWETVTPFLQKKQTKSSIGNG